MEYTIVDEVIIKRPIVFLCGPYYQKNYSGDRRNIMRKAFEKYYGKNILPLIIDDFLTEQNLRDKKINIQLLEEIFAAISAKTYIFLDTMSSATELGLFMNHAFMNQVIVYLPKQSDILNKTNVGYFVKDVVLKMNDMKAKYIEYRPAIRRSVIATDYAVEHFEFIQNQLPSNIEENIAKDQDIQPDQIYKVCVEEGNEFSKNIFEIIYRMQEGKVIINTSIKLLFLVLCQDLVQVKMRNFSPF